VDSRPDIIEFLLREELRIANKHLPVTRKTLRELLEEEFPHVVCRDGSLHFFRRSELVELSRYVPRERWDKLLLPIIIEVVSGEGGLVGIVSDPHAAEVVSSILELSSRERTVFLYKPQVYELRRRFSTVFQIALSYAGLGGSSPESLP